MDKPDVPDFFFSESFGKTETKSDGQVVTNLDEFATGDKDDFISNLASDESFWFDDSDFNLDDINLDGFEKASDWSMPKPDSVLGDGGLWVQFMFD